MKIISTWETKRGRWSNSANKYVNIQISTYNKEIEMKLDEDNKVLYFIGGPTGFESYYTDSLLSTLENNKSKDKFYICAGTINNWPACYVDRKEVMKFILDNIKKDKDK